MITRAIQRELALIRRAEIDADLLEMAQDIEYQSEVLQLEAEFANRHNGKNFDGFSYSVGFANQRRF